MTADASGTLGTGPSVASLATSASVTALSGQVASNTSSIGTINGQITGINTQIGTLNGQVSTLNGQVSTLNGQVNQLFAAEQSDRRQISRANEGVAMALAMDTPQIPAGSNFALTGGVGYFNNRTAATMAFAARVGSKAYISAGVGTGFTSGEVGARGGFGVAF